MQKETEKRDGGEVGSAYVCMRVCVCACVRAQTQGDVQRKKTKMKAGHTCLKNICG
jgi:hypothetical protein